MSSFAPQAVFTPHHFEIAENARGYWVAKDKEGLIGGVFRTQKDALRFALFEVAGDSACVRVLPPTRLRSERQAPARTDGDPRPELVGKGEAGTVGHITRPTKFRSGWRRCSRIIALVFGFFMPRTSVRARKLIG